MVFVKVGAIFGVFGIKSVGVSLFEINFRLKFAKMLDFLFLGFIMPQNKEYVLWQYLLNNLNQKNGAKPLG